MDILDALISDMIYLFFPIAMYLVYVIGKKNISRKEHDVYLEIAMISSLYLILRRGVFLNNYMLLVLANVPLLLAYLKKSTSTAILMSLILICYLSTTLGYHLLLISFEYLLYFICYSYLLRKKPTPESILSVFILIKTFMLSLEAFLFINPNGAFIENMVTLIIYSFILYSSSYIVLCFLKKGEELVDLNSMIYQLEKEKNLRSSIFKVTHEIKNPIAVCKGYLDMMDFRNEEKVRKYVMIIKEEIARTLVLLDDFLSCNRTKIEKEEVDLYLLIEEVVDALNPLFKENQVTLRLSIPDDEFYLDIDYNRIKQVLINLLKNAMEAKTKAKMKIEIKTKVTNDTFEIEIKDDGEGMDKETIKKIGEMFYTTKEKGSGLGVTLSKEIMKLHGGKLYYKSELKKGTSAILVFPLALGNE